MKKHFNPFFLLVLIFIFSCKKQEITVTNSSTPETFNAVQNAMRKQMDAKQFSNLDWAKPVVNSLDADHPNNLMKVQDKTNAKKALYYSVIDQAETAYLVTLNIPMNTSSPEEVNGSIEISSVKNEPLKKFIIKKNKVIRVIKYDKATKASGASNGIINNNNVSGLGDMEEDIDCSNCTLPPVTVYGYIYPKTPTLFYSLLYTYGGGTYYYTPGPSTYGGGGSYNTPYWDKYEPANGGDVFVNPFVNRVPNQQKNLFTPKIVKYPGYDQWSVVDNKNWTTFNVYVSFQLDKSNKLIANKTDVKLAGFMTGSLKIDPIQNPDPWYTPNSMVFNIQATYTSSIFGSLDVPISVNVFGLGTSTPKVSFVYFNLY